MRNSKEVEKAEYNEFYKKAFNEFLDPLAHTHFTTEVLILLLICVYILLYYSFDWNGYLPFVISCFSKG